MILDITRKYLYIHIPKTAGESISGILKENGGKEILQKHSSALDARNELGVWKYCRLSTFSFVRNPWDQAVSFYEHLRKPLYISEEKLREQYPHLDGKYVGPVEACKLAMRVGFGEFVEQVYEEGSIDHFYFKDQMTFLVNQKGKSIVSSIYKFENLAGGFDDLKQRYGLEGSLRERNSSKRKPYRCYYDEKSKKIVKDAHDQTIRKFNYTF